MKRFILLTTLLLVCVAAVGCMHTRYRPRSGKPVSMTSTLGPNVVTSPVRQVDEEYTRKWLLWFILPIGDDGGDMIDDAMKGADGMTNLRIKAEWDFLDLVIQTVTFGIFCTRSVEISGTLVSIQSVGGAPYTPPAPSATSKQPAPASDSSDVKLCPHCGRGNPRTAKFCQHCGKNMLPLGICPECGTRNRPDAKYCTKCGAGMPKE